MKKLFLVSILTLSLACSRNSSDSGTPIITVSIAPLKYFVEEIAGDDFSVNIMVPPGANPHIYEPYPEQINKLRRSVAYISNGFLGFELTWLSRFYSMNKSMIKMSPGDRIEPITPEHKHDHDHDHLEVADPHYWVSPRCARLIALSVRDLLYTLNPGARSEYEKNYISLVSKIDSLDRRADWLFAEFRGSSFMIFHPNLAYLARDYGLKEIAVEFEGKEPHPSGLKALIDLAGDENLNTIFVQREYDTRNVRVIADETGAGIRVIDPLSDSWLEATGDIINALHKSFIESAK